VKFSISKSFTTTTQRSARVLECAEAFGLGLEAKEFVLYDKLELEIVPGDIVFITGQSGSGKSVLLREIAKALSAEFKVSNIDEVDMVDEALIEQVGENNNDAIRILSAAGLNDAYMFIRKPKELSDGQLYRFRIAKLMHTNAQVWVADEFGAVLDRTTARVVAFNLQKMARQVGAIVVVATTHRDMIEELGPSLFIEKHYQDRVAIHKFDDNSGECPLCNSPQRCCEPAADSQCDVQTLSVPNT
jgi:ABC-type ATPase with predicted acetyltransferase domain